MAQLVNDITRICDTNLTMTTNTLVTPTANSVAGVPIDTREALSGMLQVKFATTTGGASNTIQVYAMYSYDGAQYDDANTALLRQVATITCPNDTSDHWTSIPLTADVVAGNYMKLYFYCNAASNVGILKDARVAIRRPN